MAADYGKPGMNTSDPSVRHHLAAPAVEVVALEVAQDDAAAYRASTNFVVGKRPHHTPWLFAHSQVLPETSARACHSLAITP